MLKYYLTYIKILRRYIPVNLIYFGYSANYFNSLSFFKFLMVDCLFIFDYSINLSPLIFSFIKFTNYYLNAYFSSSSFRSLPSKI